MIKGFCVINNERARSLYFDSERVVLMFARQPFTEDHKIRLPAAKRQRMEAALTLDLDLSRVEACEAFDWTRAPLEQGALLQLGAGIPQETLPSIELAEAKMPQLLDPSACEVSHQPEGWMPRFQVDAVQIQDGKDRMEDVQDCKIVAIAEGAEGGKEAPNIELQEPTVAAPGVDLETLAMQAMRCRQERGTAGLLRPGLVYGFDGNPTLGDEQRKAGETLCRPRLGAATYHEMMELDAQPADRLAPNLRLLVDPDSALYFEAGGPTVALSELPEMQSLLSGTHKNMHGDVPFRADADMYAEAAEANAIDTILNSDVVMELPEDDMKLGGFGNAEAQDDLTAGVGDLIRECLRSHGKGAISFDTIMRPGHVERTHAALTFAALLALASAGELAVQQAEPYAAIMLAEAGCI
eukprot:Skav225214  [mRNA]  locus=scaffold1041:248632:249864:- [translate_table: standard]